MRNRTGRLAGQVESTLDRHLDFHPDEQRPRGGRARSGQSGCLSTAQQQERRKHPLMTTLHQKKPCLQPPRVRRLKFRDWNDFAEVAVQEQDRVLRCNLPGCWYINPVYCVCSPCLSEVFLREVVQRQKAWYRMLTRLMGKGWRTLRKQARTPLQRATEFEGILIIDGVLAFADELQEIFRLLGHLPAVEYRNHAFRLLKSGDFVSLRQMANDEVDRCRKEKAVFAKNAQFILPFATVSSAEPDEPFFKECGHRQGEWFRKVNRLYPKREQRKLAHTTQEFWKQIPTGHLLIHGEERPLDLLHAQQR